MGPSKRWLLWVRWLTLMVLALSFSALLVSPLKPHWNAALIPVAIAALFLGYKPLKQRFEFSENGVPVTLILSMSSFCKLTLQIKTPGKFSTIKLGRYIGIPMWFEETIEVAGIQRRLLIYYRFPQGFLVSHRLNEPHITFTRNEICI